jgi:hypothetical protein
VDGIDIHRITFRCPNLNAYAERFVQSIQHGARYLVRSEIDVASPAWQLASSCAIKIAGEP